MLKLITALLLTKKIKEEAIKQSVIFNKRINAPREDNDFNLLPEGNESATEIKKPFTFTERLISSSDKTQKYFESFMGYCDKLNIKHTMYKHKIKFYDKEGKTLANLYFTHKTLRLFIAAAPEQFDCKLLGCRDFSSYKKHKETPLSILLKSNKNVENAKTLIFTKLSNNL